MKLKFIILAFLILGLSNGYANYSYYLEGQGFESFNNKFIYLTFTDFNAGVYKTKIDSTIVLSGSFSFEGIMESPGCKAELQIKKVKQVYFFILDSGSMIVKPKKNIKLSQLLIPDSKTNNLSNEINNLYTQLVLNGKPIQGKSIRDIRLLELNKIKNNPGNFYSLIALVALSRLVFSIKTEEIAITYFLLDENIKNSDLGIYLKERIRSSMKLFPGNSLPDFEFMDLDGHLINADTLKIKIYLFAFGATWCGPCQRGIPELVNIQSKIDTSEFQIVYINMDNIKENWLKMIEKQGMQSLINLCDIEPSASISKMSKHFALSGIPFYILIDQNKTICFNSYLVKDEDHTIRNKVIKETVEAFKK